MLDDLVKLCTLQTSMQMLDAALRVTNRRVNALEFVICPQLENTIAYVISELDELEREDTYRIKKVKDMRVAVRASCFLVSFFAVLLFSLHAQSSNLLTVCLLFCMDFLFPKR